MYTCSPPPLPAWYVVQLELSHTLHLPASAACLCTATVCLLLPLRPAYVRPPFPPSACAQFPVRPCMFLQPLVPPYPLCPCLSLRVLYSVSCHFCCLVSDLVDFCTLRQGARETSLPVSFFFKFLALPRYLSMPAPFSILFHPLPPPSSSPLSLPSGCIGPIPIG